MIEPEEGWQACKIEGIGRLPEPATLLAAIDQRLS